MASSVEEMNEAVYMELPAPAVWKKKVNDGSSFKYAMCLSPDAEGYDQSSENL